MNINIYQYELKIDVSCYKEYERRIIKQTLKNIVNFIFVEPITGYVLNEIVDEHVIAIIQIQSNDYVQLEKLTLNIVNYIFSINYYDLSIYLQPDKIITNDKN